MSDNTPDLNNADLIYKYTQACVKRLQENVDVITGRLTTLLGFSGVLVKFAADMNSCEFLFIFKFLTIIFLLSTICTCLAGLITITAGRIISPEDLLREEVYGMDAETTRIYLIEGLIRHMKELEDVRNLRGQRLRTAVGLSVVAILIFGVHGIAQNFVH